jgi:hypothetical protein
MLRCSPIWGLWLAKSMIGRSAPNQFRFGDTDSAGVCFLTLTAICASIGLLSDGAALNVGCITVRMVHPYWCGTSLSDD